MRINNNDLHSRVKRLEELMSSTTNEVKKLELSRDIRLLKLMLNYTEGTNYEINNINLLFPRLMNESNRILVNFFSKNSVEIYKSLYGYSSGVKLPWRITLDRCITDIEYDKLLMDFFKKYDSRLLDIYESLKSSKRIETNPKKYNLSSGSLGLNVHLITSDESFVFSRFNNKISTSSIVPHEIGHSFLYQGSNNIYDFMIRNGSLFSEAYSIFLEMIFFDYLKDTRYSKSAFKAEYSKLDSFLAITEYLHSIILLFENMTLRDGKLYLFSSMVADTYAAKLVLSNLLAMYFVDLYRNDKKQFDREINKFFEMYGCSNDEEKLKYFGLDTMVGGTNNVFNSYIKLYKK